MTEQQGQGPPDTQLSDTITVLSEGMKQALTAFTVALIKRLDARIYKLEEQIIIQDLTIKELVRKEEEREARERSTGPTEH